MTQAIDETPAAPPAQRRVLAVLSLLGEGPVRNSATRILRGRPVLAHTVDRVASTGAADEVVVLVWDDQLAAVAIAAPGVRVRSSGERNPSPAMRATTTALRWADGWRGGLLGTTEFDRGFDAGAVLGALDDARCEAVMLINPASALIEPEVLNALRLHLARQDDQAYAFAPGAPGVGAMLIDRSAIRSLDGRLPGSLLAYHPDRPKHDPLAKSFAMPMPAHVARSLVKVVADSGRQVRRLEQLASSAATDAVAALEAADRIDSLPREVVIELTTRRPTAPRWALSARRPDLSVEQARALFRQLAKADDLRVTFAGVGDPLCHPDFERIVACAREAGIDAIHVETDLLPDEPAQVDRLARSEVDVVSFHLPAAVQSTYAELMGVDRMRDVLEHVRRFLLARGGQGVPLLVPVFMKCEANLAEMETWYDQWIRALGSAVIAGPSDFSGRIPFLGASDMTPGTRVVCRRLRSRMTVLSNGLVASCEEDVLGEQPCGTSDAIESAWGTGMESLRSLHAERRWDETALCRDCRMWDRP